MFDSNTERRKYFRLNISAEAKIMVDNQVISPKVLNLSPVALSFASDKDLSNGQKVEIALVLEGALNPVHILSEIKWVEQKDEGFVCGVEFLSIEEDNKNTFLKILCDLLYELK